MHKAPAGLSGLLSSSVKRRRMLRARRYITPGGSILDLGCGLGEFTGYLPDGANYLGIDRDDYMIQRNREHLPGYHFLKLDIVKEPLPEGEWDIVLLLAVVEHLKDPASLLCKISPVLSDAGRLIITSPHPRSRAIHDFLSKIGLLSRYAEDEHETFLDRESLSQIAEVSRLELEIYETFLFGLNQVAIFNPHFSHSIVVKQGRCL